MSVDQTLQSLPVWVILGGWVVTVIVAFLAYLGNKSMRDTVNGHGEEEMALGESVRHELEQMREAQAAANTLSARMADYSSRRLDLCEKRIDRLEDHVF